ncbi:PAS domain S-box protein [Muriicola sp. Z0-33]|uniref:PAS domain S-box protein n=1 Tax=Muriicola sp. Z0-33 TaxID=2816957 RepID=UPI0022380FB3|nr:PAS domain S-box protein [Muriicola sp. Z0-33]MCW5516910.1 PAS domain S-box protein [Muriicola sp. Z0-33]
MNYEAIDKIEADILVITSDNDLQSDVSLFLKPHVRAIKFLAVTQFDQKKIAEDKSSLILLDIKNNFDSTYSLCQKLKTHKRTKELPIILIGDFSDEKISLFFEAGADELISAPLKEIELIVRVKAQLSHYFTRKHNQQLTLTERFHTSSIKVIKEGFVVHDKNDKIVSANEAAAQILGLTYNQLLGKDSFDPRWKALHEDGRPFAPEDHPSMISLRTATSVNDVIMNVHTGENERKWISINSRPIFDKDGNQTGAVATFLDITERKEANERLNETLQQLNLSIDTAKLGVWVLNIDSGDLEWNNRLLEIYGITRDEFNNDINGWQKQLHPEDAEYANVRLGEVYENKSVYDVNFRIQRPNGEIRYIDGSASPVFVNNTLKKIIGINRDITDQKSTLIELINSETRYRTLFENARDGFFLVNDSGKIIDGNSAMIKLFGYDEKSEILNLSVWDICPYLQPNGRISKQMVLEQMNGILVGDSQLLNWDHQRKDGTTFKTEVSINALQYNEKKYILGSIRDITDRVMADLALKESEEKFANAFNSSPIAQSILNLRKGHRLNVNQAFCKLFGYSREQLLNMSFKENNLAVDSNHLKTAIKKALTTGQLDDFAFDMYHSNGSIRNIIVSATNTFLNDEDIFIVSYIDVTKAREAEKKLIKAEKDVFNAIISSEEKERARYAKELHDGLGPILSTSLIYLQTMLDEEDKEKQTGYIKRTCALLEDATQSIREISSNLSPDILKKYGLVQAVRSFIERLQEVSNVKFKINANLTQELDELIDFTLYRTLTELINNSIKHADADHIVISFDQSPTGIIIKYVDDGLGFDYEKVKKESKGFGLMNLEGRIQKIGGHYKIVSSKGIGTKVEINLQTISNDTYSYN